jgi:hypothetical protein
VFLFERAVTTKKYNGRHTLLPASLLNSMLVGMVKAQTVVGKQSDHVRIGRVISKFGEPTLRPSVGIGQHLVYIIERNVPEAAMSTGSG